MVGFGVGNLYALIDTYWLSRLGPEPVAALTILGPVLWVISSANMIVGSGSVAIISRRYGEKDLAEAEMSIKETFLLKWLVAIFFGLIGFILTPGILDILGASDQVREVGIVYGRIIFIGLGFNFATYSVFTAMRGVANPKMAMILMISLSGLNIVLDPFMIFGWWIFPEMGVAGAAWASVISYAAAFCVGLFMFYAGYTNVRLRLKSARDVSWVTMWKILKIGAPAGIGSLSFSMAQLVIMPMITVFGTGVVAAYGVGMHISHVGIMLLVGIGLGMSALIGHNLGAEKKERARKTAYQAMYLATGIMTFLGLVTYIFAHYIMRMFFDEFQTIEYGIDILRILALGFPFFGLHIMMENTYTGVGENRPPMFINIFHGWILEIPAVYITTRLMGLDQNAVWWSMTGATILSVLVFYLYFRRGNWLEVKV
jgi:putative MATE family efflux protein